MNHKSEATKAPEIAPVKNWESRRLWAMVIIFTIASLALSLAYALGFQSGARQAQSGGDTQSNAAAVLSDAVLPKAGFVLPVAWGDMGQKLMSAGVIDAEKFKALYAQRGGFAEAYETWLFGQDDEKITITASNAGYLLNLFWALGLANKSPILDAGEMNDPKFGGPQNFASTGGWTLAKGSVMDHYSRHPLLRLTPEQQVLVGKVSKGIFRPCCGNSTHFPDCNHGMAMLGLLELMAFENVSEAQMWQAALEVNSFWFPETYLTVAAYLQSRGVDWKAADPQEVLGAAYSSAQGYRNIAAQVAPTGQSRGGSCGV